MPKGKEKEKEEAKEEEGKAIDLSRCKATMDAVTGEVVMSCPVDIFDKAVKVRPKRITFELMEEEVK